MRALGALHSSIPELAAKIGLEADYFRRNAERMRYPQFRAQHLLVGSSVIEAGGKAVIGAHLKGPVRSGRPGLRAPGRGAGCLTSTSMSRILFRVAASSA